MRTEVSTAARAHTGPGSVRRRAKSPAKKPGTANAAPQSQSARGCLKMASGVGVNGGRGRCYPLWLDFTSCLDSAEDITTCVDNRDDYLECLHHRKEMARMVRVADEAARKKNDPPPPPSAPDPAPVDAAPPSK